MEQEPQDDVQTPDPEPVHEGTTHTETVEEPVVTDTPDETPAGEEVEKEAEDDKAKPI